MYGESEQGGNDFDFIGQNVRFVSWGKDGAKKISRRRMREHWCEYSQGRCENGCVKLTVLPQQQDEQIWRLRWKRKKNDEKDKKRNKTQRVKCHVPETEELQKIERKKEKERNSLLHELLLEKTRAFCSGSGVRERGSGEGESLGLAEQWWPAFCWEKVVLVPFRMRYCCVGTFTEYTDLLSSQWERHC